MPAKGQSERLSRLQREILKAIYKIRETSELESSKRRFRTAGLAHRVGKRGYDDSFARSIRNLIKKGILEDATPDEWHISEYLNEPYFGHKCIRKVQLTEKGEILSATLVADNKKGGDTT